ncbi:MAG: TIGR04283 family arsenosugar biosynthesis glycosyltransferase [Bryobacteraceae bacterium]|nr:TIGR04283 family arsenosugar biosynthesis glycosyltransferase [Bryobacteraceae bacterium]
MRISVLIPTYNEEAIIEGTLRAIRAEGPYEVIVCDGGSTDATLERAAGLARVVVSARGRAVQMNAGAREASGDVLLFLHADARIAPGGLRAIGKALADGRWSGGNFRIEFEGGDWAAAVFSWINRVRCRFGVFYGDSGIFCRRGVFEQMGGFREWAILEDYEFARRLWRTGGVAYLDERIHVSARRWRRGGMMNTLWSWFWIQGLYLVGVSPDRLSRMYRDVR